MALDEYKKKRDFSKTPEPAGDASGKKTKKDTLFFCVQKHLASHLHYDLRLEWNGVLLSWAVPKGPSLNPADKRLAMHVEDHPIEYGMFEGVIPEGYGAGIVMLWDYGTWEPETDDVDASLKKGDLKFRLDGFKLKGSWVLVRTRGYPSTGSGQAGDSRPGRSWLLIKHRDDWSGPVDITTFAPYSVKTPDADLADILAADNPDIWKSHAPAKGGDTGALFRSVIARAIDLKNENAARAGTATARTKSTKDTKATKATKTAKGPKTGVKRATKNPAQSAKKAKRR